MTTGRCPHLTTPEGRTGPRVTKVGGGILRTDGPRDDREGLSYSVDKWSMVLTLPVGVRDLFMISEFIDTYRLRTTCKCLILSKTTFKCFNLNPTFKLKLFIYETIYIDQLFQIFPQPTFY